MMKVWSDEEVAVLREKWPFMFGVDLAEELGRSPESVNYKARRLGLVKDASFDVHAHYGRYTRKGNHFDRYVSVTNNKEYYGREEEESTCHADPGQGVGE